MAKPKKKSVPLNIKVDPKDIQLREDSPSQPNFIFKDPYWSNKEQKHLIALIEYPDGRQTTASIQDVDGTNPDFIKILKDFGEETIDKNTEEKLKQRDDAIKKRLQRAETEEVRAKQEMLFGSKLMAFEIELIKNSKNNTLKKLIRKAKSPLEVQALSSILISRELVLTGQLDEEASE
tara:strand:+ start:187 stop:720 length:534 start_codon:yes stop_codon:yes gene_type:complete